MSRHLSEHDNREKLARLQKALYQDAKQEISELTALLAEAQEEVCSMTCRSVFPAGHVRSSADHSEKCRRISAVLGVDPYTPKPAPSES